MRLVWSERQSADRVEITFRASKAHQKRSGAVVTRSGETLKILDLLDMHLELGSQAPRMQPSVQQRWKVITRGEATRALRLLVSTVGGGPKHFALHSGRI